MTREEALTEWVIPAIRKTWNEKKSDEVLKALEQEPKYCDRNICIRNDYNGIGCGECEVTKSQEPCEDWYDVPSDEMTLEQARQAVRDLRKMWAEHLEQEPCEDAISRQAALDTFGLSEKSRKYGGDHSGYDTIMLYEVQDALEALPPVTPKEKTGKWETTTTTFCGGTFEVIECSCCKQKQEWYRESRYCPNCGTKMVEPHESEVEE